MSNRRQRLELTWVGKDERPRLEPRILIEDAEKSFHAKARVTDHDIFDNLLIQGDNLLVLQALQQEFAGQVRLVYIDPPFNTGQTAAYPCATLGATDQFRPARRSDWPGRKDSPQVPGRTRAAVSGSSSGAVAQQSTEPPGQDAQTALPRLRFAGSAARRHAAARGR